METLVRIRKTLKFLIFFIFPLFVGGQDFQLRKFTDSIVLAIDENVNRLYSFSKIESSSAKQEWEVKYQFKYSNGQISYIVRQASNRDSSVKQEFYIHRSYLIFSNESIWYYYGNDSIGWGGGYYFFKGKLKDYETLGHGKSETETWNPEVEVLRNYQKAKLKISAYLKSINGG